MGADNTEKQGHSAFPALLPFRHLASTKGCYVTAIYTRAPFPSHPPSHVRQHHMQTKWSCSTALLQVLFLLSPFLKSASSLIALPPERQFVHSFVLQYCLNAPAMGNGRVCMLHSRWLTSEKSKVTLSQYNLQLLS